MRQLNERELEQVSGAETEGGCIPETEFERALRQMLEKSIGVQPSF